jgi:ribosomal protein S18 acetylase RimI-like enzyme
MTIRKAQKEDTPYIAECLFLAMEEIAYALCGKKDAHEAKTFLSYFVEQENNQYSYQNCWVALSDNRIAGMACVYDGGKLAPLRAPVLHYIQTHQHRDFSIEDETQSGEFYIDCIGVAPQYQGQGIGSRILSFLIEEYVIRHKQTLGLLVSETNPKAKSLYLKLGFNYVGTKILAGKNMEHLQIKPKDISNN